MLITFTATDNCGNITTCQRNVLNPCLLIQTGVYLEGAVGHPDGMETYSISMRTSLNDLYVLPGQVFVDPFFGMKYSSPGQPYNMPPWNYLGIEGDTYDSEGNMSNADAGYPATIVDWVLVSLRDIPEGTGGPVCEAAAMLHANGQVEFMEGFNCCDIDESQSYHLVIEHRNHLIVMSHTTVTIVDGKLSYDFRNQQSYIDDSFRFGIYSGQKEILPGSFAMIAGNGEQVQTSQSDTDINFLVSSYWSGHNGNFGEYRNGDFNLNADTNFNDRLMWNRSNGFFTSVPRN